MATTLEQMLDELQTHRAKLDLPQEGARDYESVNLQPPAHLLASEGRGSLTAQRALVVAAIEALQALAENSAYPELPSFQVAPGVVADLDAQIASMQAFRALVQAEPAATHMETTFTVTNQ